MQHPGRVPRTAPGGGRARARLLRRHGRDAPAGRPGPGRDVLLCEASWPDAPDRPAGLHLSGREAGEHAAAAQVGRLLLTHLLPWADRDAVQAEAAGAYAGPVEVVRCGAAYDV
jgi:ribonuclease BN (tRNA processing enzyme)